MIVSRLKLAPSAVRANQYYLLHVTTQSQNETYGASLGSGRDDGALRNAEGDEVEARSEKDLNEDVNGASERGLDGNESPKRYFRTVDQQPDQKTLVAMVNEKLGEIERAGGWCGIKQIQDQTSMKREKVVGEDSYLRKEVPTVHMCRIQSS